MPLTLLSAAICSPTVEHMLSLTQGGGDGLIRNDGDTGAVTAQGTPSLYVDVGALSGYVSHRIARLASSTTLGPITVPTGGSQGDLRRIDLVQWTLGVGPNVKEGTESATPSAPSLDADSFSLAHIYCRNGMTVIKDTDDGDNGYIVDARDYI